MRNNLFIKTILILAVLLNSFNYVFASGNVYLVIGSDTAIWDGMSTGRYNCYYNIDLYTNPSANAYKVMDPAFREQFKDSYGQPVKMTWWMMAGNIFRYADNRNVPIPNIMTLYLMKKYHGENVVINGDELTLHYHTFFWSDYNGDGSYWWNQAPAFMDSFDDFNFTLAQFLLDEKVFPVSFRSGWHYMDNEWQNYLTERVLPYSLHNDYPYKHIDEEEPTDNNYDWSQAPSAFIPYRPSEDNYQLPGNSSGWNVRSASFIKTRYNDYIDTLFNAASYGEDQIACIWGHLPETDFLTNIEIIDSLAHKMEVKYPGVKFRYCTAIEAMQRWRNSTDSQSPDLTFTELESGDYVTFKIESDETIFQTQPFVAVKDIYERYFVVPCISTGNNTWETKELFLKKSLAKAGVAVCDTMGNQAMRFIEYLPDDIYIDNLDAGYKETEGSWSTISDNAWGTDSRAAYPALNDSVSVEWTVNIPQSGYYNIFTQVPQLSNLSDSISFNIYTNNNLVASKQFAEPLTSGDWIFINTLLAADSEKLTIEMKAKGNSNGGNTVIADVIKLSALVKEKDISVENDIVDFGHMSVDDTASYNLVIRNLGIEILEIQQITFSGQNVRADVSLPLEVEPMGSAELKLQFIPSNVGAFSDTLWIMSNDPIEPQIKIPCVANVENYFEIIDNEDSLKYEEFGEWNTSVAQAYGESSRYAWLNSNPPVSARFFTRLKKSGIYNIYELLPSTVNSTDKALYEFRIQNIVVDSTYINQNEGSGSWVFISRQFIPANTEIELRVIDTGESSEGLVIRADAIQFSLQEEITDVDENNKINQITSYKLFQNYPNPFNPTTTIKYFIPRRTEYYSVPRIVLLKVYDILGNEIATLVDEEKQPGIYEVKFDASAVSSGVYFYNLTAGSFLASKKMLLIK